MFIDIDDFLAHTEAISQGISGRLIRAGAESSFNLQEQAKKAAPWRDRTGNARRSVTGSFDVSGDVLTVCLAGMMKYSPELELAKERRFSVLLPVIRAGAWGVLSKVLDDVRRR
jgi:hypothetical protein